MIIPACNEAASIGHVIGAIPAGLVDEVVVVDNGSTDRTGPVASAAGATVVHEPTRGYGNACLAGIQYCRNASPQPEIVVFMDGDFSDYPQEMPLLTTPIQGGKADLVIGSRTLGRREPGSMTIPQVFGNWLATRLLKLFFNARFTDLGPFRAVRFKALLELGMEDRTYGWTIEMQIKAVKNHLRCIEVPVRYKKRIGVSKISGTVKGTVMAGYKILYTLFKYV